MRLPVLGSQVRQVFYIYLLLISHLSSFVPFSQIVYFDLENIFLLEELNKIKNFDQFFDLLKKYQVDLTKKTYVFIDEIQYLDEPSSFLKYLL